MASLIKRSYKVKLPDGSIVTRKCEKWTIQYRDAAGKVKRFPGYKDKGATKQLAAQIERQLARGEQAMLDPFKASKARSILDHVTEYVADLKAAGRATEYVLNAERRLKVLATECGWTCLTDVDANSFTRWREKARTTPRNGTAKGLKTTSAETLNQYLDTARAFLNWCATMNRIPGVPMQGRVISTALAGVAPVEGPKVRQRRGLSDEEVQRLLAVTTADRAIVYRTGLGIGLRRQELADLLWGDVRLNAIPPYVQCRAEATKGRRADRLDLPATLADDLRKRRPEDAKDGDRVFPAIPPIEDWKDDLKAAEIPYKDEMGRQADFHGGTRKTMCSRMHRAGVPLAVAMRRMRHTDARLTMIDYTDEQTIGMAVGVLPEVSAAVPVTQAATIAG